jgi:hypothetical protein
MMGVQHSHADERPYELEGGILESCSCRAPCPCWIGGDPDGDACLGFNAYHIARGTIDGIDVAGCDFVRVFDIRGHVSAPGSWREIVVIDERASAQQASSILAAYSGALGGPLADLALLVGETLGVERAQVEYAVSEGAGTVRAGDLVSVSIAPFRGGEGEVTTLHGSLMATVPRAPAYVASAQRHRVTLPAYGFEWAFEGRSAIHSEYRVAYRV